MTITFGIIWIPIILTVLAFLVPAFLFRHDHGGMFGGITMLFIIALGGFASFVIWMVFGIYCWVK